VKLSSATKAAAAMLTGSQCLVLCLKSAKEMRGGKTVEETASVNLSRGIGTNNRISMVWCAKGMGCSPPQAGNWGDVRAKVVALARHELCQGEMVLSDDNVIAEAIRRSSYFAGLWNLIEVEIGTITRVMAHWTRGNIEPYFRMFPVLAQLVGRVHKLKVARAMLYMLERDCSFATNSILAFSLSVLRVASLSETAIENWHSILTHYVNRHVATAPHSHNEKASRIASAVRALRADLDTRFFKRKEGAVERLGSLQNMQSKALDETNERVAEFLFVSFQDMILQMKETGSCTGEYSDQLWPRSNHLQEGQRGLEKALELTEAFLSRPHRPILLNQLRKFTPLSFFEWRSFSTLLQERRNEEKPSTYSTMWPHIKWIHRRTHRSSS
jgi:hypothetical protein